MFVYKALVAFLFQYCTCDIYKGTLPKDHPGVGYIGNRLFPYALLSIIYTFVICAMHKIIESEIDNVIFIYKIIKCLFYEFVLC